MFSMPNKYAKRFFTNNNDLPSIKESPDITFYYSDTLLENSPENNQNIGEFKIEEEDEILIVDEKSPTLDEKSQQDVTLNQLASQFMKNNIEFIKISFANDNIFTLKPGDDISIHTLDSRLAQIEIQRCQSLRHKVEVERIEIPLSKTLINHGNIINGK